MNSIFNANLIKIINSFYPHVNYLVSPYSIKIALKMLQEGSDGITKEEIQNALGNEEITTITNDQIKIANALLVNNKYQNNVYPTYYSTIKNKYDGEMIFDEFNDCHVVTEWVNNKTQGMIPDFQIITGPAFIMGIINTIAMDVKWLKEFNGERTFEEPFYKMDGSIINAPTMHEEYKNNEFKYFSLPEAAGILLPYESLNGNQLEYMAILPNTSIDNFINTLDENTINRIDDSLVPASSTLHIKLSIPKYTIDFNVDKFKETLSALGINSIFANANFSRMLNIAAFVNEAKHQTHIEFNETGTKASAVTYIGLTRGMAIEEAHQTVEIKLNKPFLYLIRDKMTKNIIFLGSIYDIK